MRRFVNHLFCSLFAIGLQGLYASQGFAATTPGTAPSGEYEYPETRAIVRLVNDAAALLHSKGEAAFTDFRAPGSRWRRDDTYIFVLDPQGKMLVHADAAMEGKNQLDLVDVDGRPIVRGLLAAATSRPDEAQGWYHYQWPVPGGLLPRWKSSYVRLVTAPSGARYVVGSGVYNDRMERAFIVDVVKDAVARIETRGEAAFPLLLDPTGPFRAKDVYFFVIDRNGVDVFNAAFPSLEGRHQIDLQDTKGKYLIREMIEVARTEGAGWVDYMWPKPGESVSTQKSAYVSKAKLGDSWVVVGSGVYLAEAPKEIAATPKMTAPELMTLVRDAARIFEQKGERAFPEFREKGSNWFRDDTYFFVWSLDGIRIFHAAAPDQEGAAVAGLEDVLGRPFGRMFLETAATPTGEGWVHYMYPEPGDIFPAWKSTFVKRVTFPSGEQRIVGCGIYNMEMDEAFIEDVVSRAAALVADRGQDAFALLRDKTGPFVFLDTYVFVTAADGRELVNPAQPSLEGKNLLEVRDLNGKLLVRDYIDAAMKQGSAWVDYYWYKPGDNTPAKKRAFVKRVSFGGDTYIVGSGFYPGDEEGGRGVQVTSWNAIEPETLTGALTRQSIFGEQATLARFSAGRGVEIGRHSHPNEEYSWVTSGALKFIFADREVVVRAGEILVIPANVPHSLVVVEDAGFVDFFAPAREDWLRGEDQYLRTATGGED